MDARPPRRRTAIVYHFVSHEFAHTSRDLYYDRRPFSSETKLVRSEHNNKNNNIITIFGCGGVVSRRYNIICPRSIAVQNRPENRQARFYFLSSLYFLFYFCLPRRYPLDTVQFCGSLCLFVFRDPIDTRHD